MIFGRKTIYDYEKGLRFKHGKFVGIVEPGRHLVGIGQIVSKVDLRETSQVIGGQETMTYDGATVRFSVVLNCRITDPAIFYRSFPIDIQYGGVSVHQASASIHQQAQVSIREWVAPLTLQEVMERKAQMPETVASVLQEFLGSRGIEITSVQLLDFAISGTLRSAQADILKAELEGKAAIQRARNEASTLRSLVNSARLTQDHPGLLELRILASGQKPRVTFMVGQSELKASVANTADSE